MKIYMKSNYHCKIGQLETIHMNGRGRKNLQGIKGEPLSPHYRPASVTHLRWKESVKQVIEYKGSHYHLIVGQLVII